MKKIIDLEKEIKNILEIATQNLKLKTYAGEKRQPKLIVGQIPVEKFEGLVPCISLKTTSGKNTLEEKRLKLRVAIAIFNEVSEEGYIELYEVIETICESVIEKGIVLERFEILPEYNWEILEEQPYPYWAGEIIFNILKAKDYRTDVDSWLNGE